MGMMDYAAQGANATSFYVGYITIDPRVVSDMMNLQVRSVFSSSQVIVHEFAHQLQYWYGNPFIGDNTVRRTELVADCTAAALHALRWAGLFQTKLTEETWNTIEPGIISAVVSEGDYEINNPNHHGTPQERGIAAEVGAGLVKNFIKSGNSNAGITGPTILGNCNQFVGTFDWSKVQKPKLAK